LLASACGWDDPCANAIVARVPSPSGANVAIVFERDCGATTRGTTQVSVVSNAEIFRERPSLVHATQPGNTLILTQRNGRVAVEARWSDDQHLTLAVTER
jgi:hypothetical protein